MGRHWAWQPQLRSEHLFNPFEPTAHWSSDLGEHSHMEFEPEDKPHAEGGDPAAAPPEGDDGAHH